MTTQHHGQRAVAGQTPVPIEPVYVMRREHYERLAREAEIDRLERKKAASERGEINPLQGYEMPS